MNLNSHLSGVEVSLRLQNLGYKKLFLATGYPPDSIKAPAFIRGIVGKDFPL
jgi:hypothetical protein